MFYVRIAIVLATLWSGVLAAPVVQSAKSPLRATPTIPFKHKPHYVTTSIKANLRRQQSAVPSDHVGSSIVVPDENGEELEWSLLSPSQAWRLLDISCGAGAANVLIHAVDASSNRTQTAVQKCPGSEPADILQWLNIVQHGQNVTALEPASASDLGVPMRSRRSPDPATPFDQIEAWNSIMITCHVDSPKALSDAITGTVNATLALMSHCPSTPPSNVLHWMDVVENRADPSAPAPPFASISPQASPVQSQPAAVSPARYSSSNPASAIIPPSSDDDQSAGSQGTI